MADQAQAAANAVKDAVNNVAEQVGQLTTQDNAAGAAAAEVKTYLDEVTGEHVSKSECMAFCPPFSETTRTDQSQ